VRGKGRATCARCGGTGDRPEFGTTCMTCNGTGSVAQATLSACSSCGRTGRVKCEACYGDRACPACNGTGTSGDRCPGCGKN
jgi:RecJ-like exonuclease